MKWSAIIAAALAACAGLEAQEARPKLALGFHRAIEIALAEEGNTKVRLAADAERAARARQAQAFSVFLPNVDAAWSARDFTQDLKSVGLDFSQLPPTLGLVIPEFAGPVSTYDLRATATQTVFDFGAIRRWQSAGLQTKAIRLDSEQARLQVAALTGKAYLNAARARTAVATAEANVALAERLFKLATEEKAAGTATGLDVTRAQVELAAQKQRLIAAREDDETSRLNLLRAMNLDWDIDFTLTDGLRYQPVEIPAERAAVELALANRPDLKAEATRERASRYSYDAARFQRLPSVMGFGDYGTIGSEPTALRPTRSVGVSVKLPLFDGGRRDALRAEAASQLRSEEIRHHDLRQQAELEVRTSIAALRSADEQAKVALEALTLAEKELEQAERRARAGVATSLEVTDAQTRLSAARENRDTAVYRQRAAWIDVATALGDRSRITN
jgi:outer membrane protein TolC